MSQENDKFLENLLSDNVFFQNFYTEWLEDMEKENEKEKENPKGKKRKKSKEGENTLYLSFLWTKNFRVLFSYGQPP